MVSWRCPHCGSPQPETARCWVCRRSTTSCATCRHFRRSVAGRLGYCALDKRREPLTGEEERSCWERAPAEIAHVLDGATDSVPPVVTGHVERPAAASVAEQTGMWGPAASTDPRPDQDVPNHGMWTESGSVREPDPHGRQHVSSIRSRPWGPVPGHSEPTGWRRGIRAVTRKG